MKCDNCKHKKFHPGGSWYSVAEGGDDPFPYEYCSKLHWCGDPIDNNEPVIVDDPYINCKDYEEHIKETSHPMAG